MSLLTLWFTALAAGAQPYLISDCAAMLHDSGREPGRAAEARYVVSRLERETESALVGADIEIVGEFEPVSVRNTAQSLARLARLDADLDRPKPGTKVEVVHGAEDIKAFFQTYFAHRDAVDGRVRVDAAPASTLGQMLWSWSALPAGALPGAALGFKATESALIGLGSGFATAVVFAALIASEVTPARAHKARLRRLDATSVRSALSPAVIDEVLSSGGSLHVGWNLSSPKAALAAMAGPADAIPEHYLRAPGLRAETPVDSLYDLVLSSDDGEPVFASVVRQLTPPTP